MALLVLGTAVTFAQNAVTTFAGAVGSPGLTDAAGTAAQFRPSAPSAAVVDGSGNLFLADTGNNSIRKVTPAGVVSTFAGASDGQSGYVDASGTNARFNAPQGLAIDTAGNLFVADTGNQAIRMITSAGVVSTLGGSPSAGYVDATGTNARFRNPKAVAVPGAGVASVVFVADTGNHVLRQIVVATGEVTTLAGSVNSLYGYVDDVGAAARFNSPQAIVADATGGTLYVADTGNHVIRTVAVAGGVGTVTTLAGSGAAGYAEGTGPAAQFNAPRGLALEVGGSLLVADSLNQVIRRVNAAGTTVLYAGTPGTAGAVDSLATNSATFATPAGVAIDGTTVVYVVDSDNAVIRKIAAAQVPTFSVQPANLTLTVGRNATFTAQASGNPAVTYRWQRQRVGDATFTDLGDTAPYSGTTTTTLTITGVGAAMNGDQLRLVATNSLGSAASSPAQLTTTLGTIFSTYAGKPATAGFANGQAAAALFNTPTGVALSATGVVYVADANNNVIRAIAPNGTVSTLAGTAGQRGTDDGFGAAARFNGPTAVTIDSSGTLYVADTSSHTIRQILSNGNTTTLAGTPGVLGSTDAIGTAARFALPGALSWDAFTGAVYVADTVNQTIRRISANGSVATIAGTVGATGTADGNGANARFNFPQGLAVDASGNVYIADTLNHTIRRMSPTGNVVTIAGTAGSAGSADGNGAAARFREPHGLVYVDANTLYIADTGNHTIRRLDPATGDVTTVAGTAGSSGTADGISGDVRFNAPLGLAVDASGNLYIADTQNQIIRRSGANAAPAIQTPPADAQAVAGTSASFTVVASGLPSPVYQWQRQPAAGGAFVNLNNDATYRGVTTPTLTILAPIQAMSGDRFQVVVSNLVSPNATSNPATLTVLAPSVAPSISTQPASVAVNVGDSASVSVTAAGSAPLTYQWLKNGVTLAGATNATLATTSAQPADAGIYTVVVTNPVGAVTSQPAVLTVNTAPVLATPVRTQLAIAGGAITLGADITGGGGMTFQWRKNGTAIAGATNSTLTLSNVSAADAALYDVIATNSLGTLTTAPAQLTVVANATAPVITAQPARRVAVAGGSVTFTVGVAAVPAPTYQWRKAGAAISGATSASYTLTNVQTADAADYDVVVTNSAGTTTSATANLRVLSRNLAGVYFGTFGNGLGTFALDVRPDNSAVFLGAIPASNAAFAKLNLAIGDGGEFTFSQASGALASTTISGVIASNGTIAGTLSGGASGTLAGSQSAAVGATQALAGFYLAGAAGSAGNALTILSATGQAYAVVQLGGAVDGGLGTVTAGGQVAVSTARTAIAETITPASGAITATASGGVTGAFSGAGENALGTQRLANISSRAKVGSGDAVAIAGFVITGTESKLVLIRAVGPTLVNYGVSAFLATPKLDLYRGTTLLTSNTGVSTSANAAAIAAAANRVGAFALGSSGNDSAILTTLAPGGYSAQVSGTNGATGIALVEVYDLSPNASGQKIVDIATRAPASAGDNALIAGVVINPGAPKRVLIRAVGPGLTGYNVSGVLAQPVLELKTQSGQLIAANTNWSTSADAAAITAAALDVGAFPLTSGDSALIVTLPPGGYSAQVTGANGTTGVALVEVYELQ